MSLSSKTRKIHFVGIGGIGMSGLAELLLGLGHCVSGSDVSDSESVKRLKNLGAQIQIGHNDEILENSKPDVLVYSTAVKANNPELLWAKKYSVPVIRRAEMLAEIMRLKQGIAVGGSHGKTTTTGLVSLLLKTAGLDPTVVIGGKFDAIGSNAAWGGGNWLVAEADESDGTFLKLSPEIAIVTNVDREHMDHYGSFDVVTKAFLDFIDRVPFYGKAILCSDCPNLWSLRDQIQKPKFWYGLDAAKRPDFLITIKRKSPTPRFHVSKLGTDGEYKKCFDAELKVSGTHNVLNATAAAICAYEVGVSNDDILKGLSLFTGVRRRFELRGYLNEHPVFEDYAHHPTEIRSVISAARDRFPAHEPLVLFQPHRYTRTRDQWSEFSTCFEGAKRVFTLPIYAASEPREDWVTQFDRENFSKNILGVEASSCESLEAAKVLILDSLKALPPHTPLFVMGAGDVYKIFDQLNLSLEK